MNKSIVIEDNPQLKWLVGIGVHGSQTEQCLPRRKETFSVQCTQLYRGVKFTVGGECPGWHKLSGLIQPIPADTQQKPERATNMK